MTPTGSFQGSNRLTWTTSGSLARTLYWRTISSTNGRGISRFLTESGSMHGGANTVRSRGMPAGTNSGIVHTEASYCSTKPWKNFHTVGFASVRSMWQRQIHLVFSCATPALRAYSSIAAG